MAWIVRLIIVLGAILVARYFGVSYEVRQAFLLAGLFVLLIGVPLGFLVGHFLSRNSDVDTMPFKIIAGANLVAWLVPVAGVTLAAITSRVATQSDTLKGLYQWLGMIGLVLAVGNAGIGGAHAMAERQARQTAIDQGMILDSGLRSTERCPYAAREAWSREDIDKYCPH